MSERVEFERRFKVSADADNFIRNLAVSGIEPVAPEPKRVIDEWLVPSHISSYLEQRRYYDQGGAAWRIRQAAGEVELSRKRALDSDHSRQVEKSGPAVNTREQALLWLSEEVPGFRIWLTVDKRRWTFRALAHPYMVPVLDKVEGLPYAVFELESKYPDPEQARRDVDSLTEYLLEQQILGRSNELNIGLALIVAETLADFTGRPLGKKYGTDR